ncbi:hypothetical protein PpBr36_05007 [Pyricularia pennisetigena]|uniref:hypothetical protein n=1 Tax=Pyricularia pennisetigena TaxID=1578925 RepID=UPI001154A4A2|nr:hypothetical protein PpBr36_05007 [Pyricularia pennisetigena]TLS26144.1 hypothetical protein PpBr36_05007 [Pyricularia pennisetigena]
MKHNLPAVGLIHGGLALPDGDVVAHDLDVAHGLLPNQLPHQSLDDGAHAAAQDDDGDVVVAAPLVEARKRRVELDILEQQVDALVEGHGDRLQHAREDVAEVDAALEHVDVGRPPLLATVAEVVRQPVVGVLHRYCSLTQTERSCTRLVLPGTLRPAQEGMREWETGGNQPSKSVKKMILG